MPWSLETFRSLMGRPTSEVWVAERGGQVVGFYVLWCVADQAEIANIAVAPSSRGEGLGGKLLDHALCLAEGRGAESVFLEVRASNEAARALYVSRGFEKIGIRKAYYDRPREDAQLMVRHLHRRRA